MKRTLRAEPRKSRYGTIVNSRSNPTALQKVFAIADGMHTQFIGARRQTWKMVLDPLRVDVRQLHLSTQVTTSIGYATLQIEVGAQLYASHTSGQTIPYPNIQLTGQSIMPVPIWITY